MSLLNRKQVKQLILDTIKQNGRGETRVGSATFDYLEEVMKKTIEGGVLYAEKGGKTLTLSWPNPTDQEATPEQTQTV